MLFFDEIDALRGQGLLSVLRQLREGFPDRPAFFPASVILCGLRDVRDYKAASGGNPERLGTSSPFNIKVEALRLGDFTAEEVRDLYAQHTSGTRYTPFSAPALSPHLRADPEGSTWSVKAAPCHPPGLIDGPAQRPASPPCDRAPARGRHHGSDTYQEDVQYLRDLGLCATNNPLRVANPIYREVIARVLAGAVEIQVEAEPKSFVLPDGRLDFDRLLREFTAFWRQHGEVLTAAVPYHEAAPQLVFMAFLQRVVNGGGFMDREYGVGRGRIDLLVRWPYPEQGQRRWQLHAVELKLWRENQADPLSDGLVQLDGYLERLGLPAGVLVLFDRRAQSRATPPGRFEQAQTASGRSITVLRV